MKFLLTLLIASMPMVANGQEILATAADTGMAYGMDAWNEAITAIDWGWAPVIDSAMISSGCVKHDTTKEYISAVEDKCDTTWGKHWVKYKKIDGEQYFKRMAAIDSVHCYVDTTWADKKLIYLTPDELKELRKLLKCH